jgi:chemotaxis protein MotB
MQPVQVGEKSVGSGADIEMSIINQAMLEGQPRSMLAPTPISTSDKPQHRSNTAPNAEYAKHTEQNAAMVRQLEAVADEVEQAMAGLVEQNLIAVRRHGMWVEVEIRTDILFPSGVATLSPDARKVIAQLAETMKPFPNPIRVEGHTDNRPINTAAFPSNWELSSARAASVVHLFTETGVNPARLAVIGLGEFRNSKPNDTAEGRNANRRVVLVILGGDGSPEGSYSGERGAPDDLPGEESAPPVTTDNIQVNEGAAPAPIEAAMPAMAMPTVN